VLAIGTPDKGCQRRAIAAWQRPLSNYAGARVSAIANCHTSTTLVFEEPTEVDAGMCVCVCACCIGGCPTRAVCFLETTQYHELLQKACSHNLGQRTESTRCHNNCHDLGQRTESIRCHNNSSNTYNNHDRARTSSSQHLNTKHPTQTLRQETIWTNGSVCAQRQTPQAAVGRHRCLTTSLPHYLTASLPHYLTTSLPHCLTTSLPHYLTVSLPHYLSLRLSVSVSVSVSEPRCRCRCCVMKIQRRHL
jgi:hypothetical protein